jgi:DNA-directed RNA polymerase subunit RPC12/RpoP
MSEIDWMKDLPSEKQDKAINMYKKIRSKKDLMDLYFDYHPEGKITVEPIKSLDEYLNYIRENGIKKYWFRGESKDHKALKPKLFRNCIDSEIDKLLIKERKYFHEFKRRGKVYLSNINEYDPWPWYFLIQHYGGPTRLLDWTQNAATALFFAISAYKNKKDNPIVYFISPTVLMDFVYEEAKIKDFIDNSVLNPGEKPSGEWICNITSIDIKSIIQIPKVPIPLLPVYGDQRIISQNSCFILFGRGLDGFTKDGKDILCPCCGNRILYKMEIDGSKRDSIKKELKQIGISSAQIYPGLEGLNKDIYEEIFEKED